MVLRFYSNAVSQASRSVASAIMIVGFLLIGFGVLIFALPRLFAFLAAAMFFLAGIGCFGTAVRIFWAQHRIDQLSNDEPQVYRENVRIHTEEHHDL
jgi:uncharacterized membrane protein YedE/YeeE